jgi:hypothetical protein
MMTDATQITSPVIDSASATVVGALGAQEVHAAVQRSMCMNVLVVLNDHIIAAAVAAHAANTVAPIAEEISVTRASTGRQDAFACQRLYGTLAGLVGMIWMGSGERAEFELGSRDRWAETPSGRWVLRLRRRVGRVLKAYDRSKRESAALRNSQRVYTVQTSGYVAVLQALLGSISVEARDSPVALQAVVDAMRLPKLYRVAGNSKRWSFWEASGLVHDKCTETSALRFGVVHMPGAEVSASIVAAATVFSNDGLHESGFVWVTPAYTQAARIIAKDNWPECSRFYGKDHLGTEEKLLSKRRSSGIDEHEVGEVMGFRPEWAQYMNDVYEYYHRNSLPVTSGTQEVSAASPFSSSSSTSSSSTSSSSTSSSSPSSALHHAAAFVLQVRARPYGVDAVGLPTPSGVCLHAACAVSLEVHPLLLSCRGRDLDAEAPLAVRPPPSWWESSDSLLCEAPLTWLKEFTDHVSRQSTLEFRSWSGGCLLTDMFPDFFREVWKRFNTLLWEPHSPWRTTVEAWTDAVVNAQGRGRAKSGLGKLMHPWRAMRMQQDIARDLLAERSAEASADPDTSTPVGVNLQDVILRELVGRLDYAPHAPHLVRCFCPPSEGMKTENKREVRGCKRRR